MIIRDRQKDLCFEDLMVGEQFKKVTDLYVKVQHTYLTESGSFNCVNTKTGELVLLDDRDPVQRILGKDFKKFKELKSGDVIICNDKYPWMKFDSPSNESNVVSLISGAVGYYPTEQLCEIGEKVFVDLNND